MLRPSRNRWLAGVIATLVVTSLACSARTTAPESTISQEQAAAPRSTAPKILIWAGLREPASFDAVIGLGGSGSPASEVTPVVHNFLVVDDHRFDAVPQLAVERPSVEKGTWRVNPDGSMVTTWRIRPNVKWHDGTPFTSADLLFTATVDRDKEIPFLLDPAWDSVEEVQAPDPQTITIRWRRAYINADERTSGRG